MDEVEEGGIPVRAEDAFVVPVCAGYEDTLGRRLRGWQGEVLGAMALEDEVGEGVKEEDYGEGDRDEA